MKRLAVIAALCLLLAGCGKSGNIINPDEARLQNYETYIAAIQSNPEFLSASSYFDLTVNMSEGNNGRYRYDVVLSHPRVAMYNIAILVIPVDVTGAYMTDKNLPSAGILENDVYNMIPNQENLEKGYPSGIIVSGESETPNVNLRVLVVWNGYAVLAENREFVELSAVYTPAEQTEPAQP